MSNSLRNALFIALLGLFGLTACGSSGEATAADGDTSEEVEEDDHDSDSADDDHDEDHGDDHDDEDDDHDDEDDDHGDEDHDEEHDDDHDDDSTGGLAAHEHGTAELSIAWTDGDMVVELVSPAFNIFGFEYEPSTDEDQAVVETQTENLTAPGVIAFNAEAGCELAADVATDTAFEGSHSEVTATWQFECSAPDDIKELDATALFSQFPNLEDVDAQWVSPTTQSAGELSPADTILKLG